MDCQDVAFSTQQSQKRINKALRILPSKVLNRILSFALYVLGVRLSTIGLLMEMSEESVKTMVNRVMKDGLPAFRDRRQSCETPQTKTAFVTPVESRAYATVKEDYCEIRFEKSNHRIKILKRHQVHMKTVLLSLLHVMDNLSTHRGYQFCETVATLSNVSCPPQEELNNLEKRVVWLKSENKRIVIHFTPYHGSWPI